MQKEVRRPSSRQPGPAGVPRRVLFLRRHDPGRAHLGRRRSRPGFGIFLRRGSDLLGSSQRGSIVPDAWFGPLRGARYARLEATRFPLPAFRWPFFIRFHPRRELQFHYARARRIELSERSSRAGRGNENVRGRHKPVIPQPRFQLPGQLQSAFYVKIVLIVIIS